MLGALLLTLGFGEFVAVLIWSVGFPGTDGLWHSVKATATGGVITSIIMNLMCEVSKRRWMAARRADCALFVARDAAPHVRSQPKVRPSMTRHQAASDAFSPSALRVHVRGTVARKYANPARPDRRRWS